VPAFHLPNSIKFSSNTIKKIAISLVFILGLIAHVWQLHNLPRGLYVDESSIGLNAYFISEMGVDEHQVAWPVFFKAFGEYKNPLYIYAVAGVFKVMGVSEFSLRLTSVLFFYLFFIFFFLLIKRLFKNNWTLKLYATISAMFLPWFFNLSRISFEVISQLTLVTAFLYFVHRTYSTQKSKSFSFAPFFVGITLGLSFYSYSTARLLSGLLLMGLFFIYRQKKYYLTHLKVGLSCLVMLIPLVMFAYHNPNALTGRFKQLTYVYDESLSVQEKANTFFENYLSYYSPSYLFISGDSIKRHHPGPSGELFIVVGLLSIIGIYWLAIHDSKKLFHKYLLFLLLIAPVGAALTGGDSSLRSLLVGLGLLILSCFGLYVFQKYLHKKVKRGVLLILMIVLLVDVGVYLHNYFVIFPSQSVWDYQSYDTKKSLVVAVKNSNNDAIMSSKGNMQYAHAQFYSLILGLPLDAVPVARPVATEGRCVVVTAFDWRVVDESKYEMKTFGGDDDFTKVKCFYDKF
jgi:4-amino-4-deoxy-L-arabinose transferase-like glycosyltransferase